MGVPPKVQPMFVSGLCLALSSKTKKSYCLFGQNSSFVSPKTLTPYWAPKDVKSSSIIEECFARVNKRLAYVSFNIKVQKLIRFCHRASEFCCQLALWASEVFWSLQIREFRTVQSILLIKKFLQLVDMTFGLVQIYVSLKLTFFATYQTTQGWLSLWSEHTYTEKETFEAIIIFTFKRDPNNMTFATQIVRYNVFCAMPGTI